MFYRRALFAALAPVVVILPLWLLLSRGIVTGDTGWDFVAYLALAPIVGVALAIVSVLTWLRGSVRTSRAVSPRDALVLSAWWLSILVHGIAWVGWLSTLTAAIGVVLALVAIWSAGSQLAAAARARIDEVNLALRGSGAAGGAGAGFGAGGGYDPRADSGPIISIDPKG